MRQLMKSSIVLTLTILWLILRPGLVEAQPPGGTPSSTAPTTRTVTVPESLLRRATAKIDSLDLELRWAHNRAVERDSLAASQLTYWRGMWTLSEERAEAWERRANSWWHKHESAFWVAVGTLLAALGLR